MAVFPFEFRPQDPRFRPGGPARRGSHSRGGFSLLEVMAAISILAVGCGAVIQSIVSANRALRFAEERWQALESAENVVEALQAETFEEVFARYDSNAANDPPGDSPGANFAVLGLRPQTGDADGLPGAVEFPGNGVKLLENVVDAELGMPRDLNGDLAAPDGNDHSGDYSILPVRVRVRWDGVRGASEIVLVTTLTSRGAAP